MFWIILAIIIVFIILSLAIWGAFIINKAIDAENSRIFLKDNKIIKEDLKENLK